VTAAAATAAKTSRAIVRLLIFGHPDRTAVRHVIFYPPFDGAN
jgi:hypothetical protein